MLRAADIQLPPFNLMDFSIDIFLRIFTHLLPEQIVWLTAVHRDFNIVKEHEYFADMWGIKSELHFPSGVLVAGNTHVMFQQFKDIYIGRYNIETKAETIKLSPMDHERSRLHAHLFSMVIEGETTLFNKRKLKEPKLYSLPIHNVSLEKLILHSKHQSMRDTLYAAVTNEYKVQNNFYITEEIDTQLRIKNKTILRQALEHQQPLTHIQMLLDNGSSYEEIYDFGLLPIHLIVMTHSEVEVIQHLLQKHPAHLNAKTLSGNTPFILACCHAKEKVIQFLLNQEDIDTKTPIGTPNALILTAKSGNTKSVEVLLKSEKAKSSFYGKEFLSLVTMLDFAKDEILKICLNNFPNLIHQVDNTGSTLLMHTCKKRLSMAEYFLDKIDAITLTRRTNDDHPTYKNMSVLDIAISQSSLRLIELILKTIKTRFHKASDNIWKMLTQGYSLAKEKKQFQIAALLLQNFTSLAVKDNQLDKNISALTFNNDPGNALKCLFDINSKPDFSLQIFMAGHLAKERIPFLYKQYIDNLPLEKNKKVKLQTACNYLNNFIQNLEIDHRPDLFRRNIGFLPKGIQELVFTPSDLFVKKFEKFNQDLRKYITGKLLDILKDLDWFLEWKKDFATTPKEENNLGMRM